jgi:2-methylisocitrate lyase-like PEP mutase family enzyme
MTATSTQAALARQFQQLHTPGRPLILFNVWDAGSARSVAGAGATAIATGSWSVAAAQGLEDGERLPLEATLSVLRQIVAVTGLPVSADLESGYGATAEAVAGSVRRAIDAGIVGCNLEDADPRTGSLWPLAEQAARLAAARGAAEDDGLPLFINARCDLFLRNPRERHAELVDDALERAAAYAQAGADGYFVPGLVDPALVERLCRDIALPLNVMVLDGLPGTAVLAELGVARISHGPGPYLHVQAALAEAARRALAA